MYTIQKDPRGSFTPNSAGRSGLQLVNGRLGKWLTITGRATVQVAAAAAQEVRNRGSVFGLLSELVVTENRQERHLLDGPTAVAISAMNRPSDDATTVRLPTNADGTVPIGTYNLVETIRVFFAWPFAVNPNETAYIEKDMRTTFEVLGRLEATPKNGIITESATPSVTTITNISFTVTQEYLTAVKADAPFFIPTVRQMALNVNGPIAKEPLRLLSNNPIRAMVITQRVDGYGEVDDIITQLTLRGDNASVIGDAPMAWLDAVQDAAFMYGGSFNGAVKANLPVLFQDGGFLGRVLNPLAYANLRLEVWGQKSAKGGAGQNMVRVTLLELEHVNGITQPTPFTV